MRASNRLLGLTALLAVLAQRPAHAETPFDRMLSLIRELSSQPRPQDATSRTRPRPQAIAAGGDTVDLSDLSRPTMVEFRLHSALQPSDGGLRLTIPGGTAHR